MPDPGSSAPPNPYQSLATMPGAPPASAAKPEPNATELLKGFHGIFKAMDKMGEMSDKLVGKFAAAKKIMKEAAADVLGGEASSLDADDSSSSSTPPAGTPPPSDPGASAPPPPGPTS